MRHDSSGKIRANISMEEYLKKRQTENMEKNTKKSGQPEKTAVLKLAELLYV